MSQGCEALNKTHKQQVILEPPTGPITNFRVDSWKDCFNNRKSLGSKAST